MDENSFIDQIMAGFRDIDLSDLLKDIFGTIANGARRLGRVLTGQLLCLYYVLKEGGLSGKEKAWVYAALAYVLLPGDLIPRRLFHLLGITDDALALGYVIAKMRGRVTPQIRLKVDVQLDKWFGYEATRVDEQ